MTQFQYFSHNLATIQVSELQMSFVTYTQTDVRVVYLKFLQISSKLSKFHTIRPQLP